MVQYVEPEVMISSEAFLIFGIIFIVVFHLTKKTGNFIIRALCSISIGFISIMPLYNMSTEKYLEISSFLLSLLIANIKEIVVILVPSLSLLSIAPKLAEKVDSQYYRSFYHCTFGAIVVALLLLSRSIAVLGLSFSITLFLIAEYLRKCGGKDSISLFVRKVFNKAMRGHEISGYVATFFYLIGCMGVIFLMKKVVAVASILILSLADPSAVIVGRKYGKHLWNHNPKKSIEGTVAFFITSLFIVSLFGFPLTVAFTVAFSTALFESIDVKISDNIIIPLISGMLMSIM